MGEGVVAVSWQEYREGWTDLIKAEVIEEGPLTIYANGRELATIMCSPMDQDLLALGFLRNEGFFETLEEIDHVHISQDGCCVDVWLTRSVRYPERRILTSGCGGGVSFTDPDIGIHPLADGPTVDPQVLFSLFPLLHFPDSLHARARGVHAAALSDGVRILALTEDVGRHNTMDKLMGACLRRGIDTRGGILLATGRISSEMMIKGARMGCPIIASRNSPTSLSVAMAQAWNITLVGYARQHRMRVYSHPARLGYPGASDP